MKTYEEMKLASLAARCERSLAEGALDIDGALEIAFELGVEAGKAKARGEIKQLFAPTTMYPDEASPTAEI